ncbi:androgen-dependent TFPI-regulating protein-like [Aricia agestis]|uniref:androgen-dependent TFPI-regulating protein-like n=1 Tax=Aricia agestis TaxID=91739 RepID=UPI001C205B77|nr:androgen-dependent TFPI-regulating protein-like [Aricia agestis]
MAQCAQNNACSEKNVRLLKIRITTYVSALVFLSITALRLLNLDFESHSDVEIQQYAKNKWKLVTTWFNLVIIGYLPVCAYCDWRDLRGQESMYHVVKLNKIRTFLFTNIIFPTTAFSDTLFWGLWNKNKALLMPLSAETVVSIWSQHAMHTFSFVFVVVDLLLVLRTRPKNPTKGILAMMGFVNLYAAICVQGVWNGVYFYPCFKNLSSLKFCVLILFSYLGHLFYYLVQWLVVDVVKLFKLSTSIHVKKNL